MNQQTLIIDPEQTALDMVVVPGGTFMMGSPNEECKRYSDEGPQHQVTVPEFLMGKYPITQAQYQAVMGSNPLDSKGITVRWSE